MINIQNISIRKRLIIILAVWITIFICFGAFVINTMKDLNNISTDIYSQTMEISNAAIECRVDVIKIQKTMRELLLSSSAEEVKKQEDILQSLQQDVIDNLNIIKNKTTLEKVSQMEKETREAFMEWTSGREQVINLFKSGKSSEALDLTLNKYPTYVNQCEDLLTKIKQSEEEKAAALVSNSKNIETNRQNLIIAVIADISIIMLVVFITIINSILKPISRLKDTMDSNTNAGTLLAVEVDGNNEVSDMSKYYNTMIKKLGTLFWSKDGENLLAQQLSGFITLEELSQRIINFLCRYLNAGEGVLYVNDKESKTLKFSAAFAYTEKVKLKQSISLGEGIVGQVALEKRPILLKDINKDEKIISTALLSEKPLCSYTFPLVFEEKLYGVIELASLRLFTEEELEFIDVISKNIAVSIYTSLQNEEIKYLLNVTEEARKAADNRAEQLRIANGVMEKQQIALQQQTEELQQTNAELEEQQQLLQQQSEEMQQTNEILEEQQRQLEEQTRILDSQNRKLEQSGIELAKRTEELEVINKYKSEFLANMSHELRTPLNSIILLSKLLLDKGRDRLISTDQHKIGIINESGKELLRLINDILDLSKVESGMIVLEKQFFHSSKLAREMENMFESLASDKGLELSIQDNLNSEFYGDEHKIAQIIRNLIANAIKFTEKGSVQLVINKDLQVGKGVAFSVKDTGIGISEDKLEMIFNEFQQVDGSVSRKYGGTGLGLSISKKLAELMNGDIKLHSIQGVGSEFVLVIPGLIIDQENLSSQYVQAEVETAATIEAATPLVEITGSHILIIEDDTHFADYVKDIIEGMGFKAIVAGSGRRGIEYAAKYLPRGILLDLGLPDISGMEVLRELKSTVELRDIPVQIISVNDRDNKAERAGAIGYAQKPVEENNIVMLVRGMISFSEKNPKKLLLIEDNYAQQHAVSELLEDNSLQIEIVDTEEAAKYEIENGDYDVIILDLKLKEGSGQNVCKFIGDKGLNIPVIVYTGRELTLTEEKDIRKFADSIIIKTANSEERLLDEVTLFLHKIKKNNKINNSSITTINKEHALNLQGKTILIVDDDPRNVYSLASVLEECNAKIIEAENGIEAIRRLEKEKADLVLMDIMMPEMDGYETIEKIRSNSKLRNLPIIAVTAKSLKEDRERCISAGANDYISKPIDYNNLTILIKAWIDKKE